MIYSLAVPLYPHHGDVVLRKYFAKKVVDIISVQENGTRGIEICL